MKIFSSIVLLIGVPAAVALATPDIEVQKSVNNAFPMTNEPVEFTVRVSNVGDETAADLVIVDQLPAEILIPVGTAAFPSIGNYDPATGEWSIGNLDVGVSAILVVPAVVTELQPPACIVNSASSEHPDDVNNSNDEARAAIHQDGVERCVDLGVNFGISAGPRGFDFPTCDLQGRYDGDVDVTNYGLDAARNVVVSIAQNPVVGPNLRFDDADCSNAPAPRCNITEIAAGETVTIDVTSDLYQNYRTVQQTISSSATTSDTDYDPSNNSPSGIGTAGGFSSCEEPDFGLPDCLGFLCPAGSSGCFIATAAYGTPLDPHLDSLRDFRDRFMMTNRPGRALVRFYYRHAPPLADLIADRDLLRAVVRGLLTPIVYTIEYPGPAALLFFSLMAAVLVRRLQQMSMVAEQQVLAESSSSNRWFFSGTKDRDTLEAAIHILVAKNSVRTSASPPKAAAELISLPGAADDPLRPIW
jgi:uncharacterized repeat protein (TIGR01451 family)